MLVDEAARAGLAVSARDGYRTFQEQASVLKRRGQFGRGGTAAPVGRSYHNYGFALDVAITPARWDTFGAIAEGLGFRWGGRFSKREPWHIDLGSFLTIDEARDIFDRAYLREV